MSTPPRTAPIALLLLGASAFAQQDFSQVEIQVVPVAGPIYMLQGAGGNIGVSVGDDGIVVIDDQYAPLAGKIQAALAGIRDEPVRFVINTHYHFDHTGGNLAMHETYGAPIIAHENVRKRLATSGTAGNGGNIAFDYEASPAGALPVVTFEHGLSLHVNGEEIRALHMPHGHTDGDTVVFFQGSNVVHTGDNFVRYGFPFIDVRGGGSIDGMIEAVERVIAAVPDDVKVIPGHGDLATVADMREFVTMLKETRAAVLAALAEGSSLAQMKDDGVLDEWDAWGRGFVKTDDFVDAVYNSLTGQLGGAVMRHN